MFRDASSIRFILHFTYFCVLHKPCLHPAHTPLEWQVAGTRHPLPRPSLSESSPDGVIMTACCCSKMDLQTWDHTGINTVSQEWARLKENVRKFLCSWFSGILHWFLLVAYPPTREISWKCNVDKLNFHWLQSVVTHLYCNWVYKASHFKTPLFKHHDRGVVYTSSWNNKCVQKWSPVFVYLKITFCMTKMKYCYVFSWQSNENTDYKYGY